MLVGMSILGCTPGFVPPEHRIEMLASLEAGIDQLFDNSLGMQSGDISHNPPSWETQAVLLTTLRYMKKRFKQGGPSDALSQRAISLDQVRILQPLAGKASIASVDGYDRPVLCEWINYDLHTMDLGPASMFARVGAIVHNFAMEPPPADFNVLHCRGYFHDLAEARFGMLFDYPLSAQPANIPPVALRDMMKQQPRPSLECLFCLAQSLVKSLHCFHRANWLHNISSHNVLFFSDTQEVAAGNISHDEHGSSINVSGYPTPYLVGFNHSRPSDSTAFTRGPLGLDKSYMHPEYAKLPELRFRRGYDYYSVGLLLLEIGLWKPISQSGLFEADIESFVPSVLQAVWRDEAVPLLGPLMGAIYKRSVLLCLNDHFTGSGMSDYVAMERFGKEVVGELNRCCA